MLSLLALSCPQCSAPLPRAARWRTVNCSYCGATITRGEETVERESFRAALRRANADVAGGRILKWRESRYRVLAPLATGEHIDCAGWCFEIVALEGRRIDRVLASHDPAAQQED